MRLSRPFCLAASLFLWGCDGQEADVGQERGQDPAPARFERPDPTRVRITIDGPVQDQETVTNCLSALEHGFGTSGLVTPFGVTNTRFEGRMFWDADMWVFPYAAVCDPDLARRIVRARVGQYPQAKKNYSEWVMGGRQTATGRHVPDPRLEGLLPGVEPAKFAWESDAQGMERAPSDTRFEEHVSGDVAWMLRTAARFGLADKAQSDEINRSVAAYYLARGTWSQGKGFGILGVVSPDEWHKVDHDLFTNSVAHSCLIEAGVKLGGGYARFAKGGTYASFAGDDYELYQQAAALLTGFPLGWDGSDDELGRLLEHYKDRHARQGPAMSDTVSATIAARLGRADLGLDLWRRNLVGRSEDNALTLREKPKGESYFLTGAAGMVNTVLYGFLGMRFPSDHASGPGAVVDLGNGSFVQIRPNLPSSWKALEVEGIVLGGRRCKVRATHETVEVTWDGDPPGSTESSRIWKLPSK